MINSADALSPGLLPLIESASAAKSTQAAYVVLTAGAKKAEPEHPVPAPPMEQLLTRAPEQFANRKSTDCPPQLESPKAVGVTGVPAVVGLGDKDKEMGPVQGAATTIRMTEIVPPSP